MRPLRGLLFCYNGDIMSEEILDPRKLSKVIKTADGKKKIVTDRHVVTLSGNGKVITYDPNGNKYYGGNKGKPLDGKILENALLFVRWEFSDVERGKDKFPPTPENIEMKRTELFGSEKPRTPEDITKIYNRTSPSHIDPNSEYGVIGQRLENSDPLLGGKI